MMRMGMAMEKLCVDLVVQQQLEFPFACIAAVDAHSGIPCAW